MVKAIIACGDLHIRNYRRNEEYYEQFRMFIDKCKEISDEYDGDVRIVVTGDILHGKLDVSAEGYKMAGWLIRELSKIARTYIIAGNHDLNKKNLTRISPLDTIFNLGGFDNAVFLDKELGYKSGCLRDENILWCLYSEYDSHSRPSFEDEDDSLYKVGLVHGDISGSKTDTGYSGENGLPVSHFKGLDLCFCGHIHKRQTLTYDTTDIIYTGSLIQQDHGENIKGHGFVAWDVEDEEYREYDLDHGDYGFYTFQVRSIEDIEENREEILNL